MQQREKQLAPDWSSKGEQRNLVTGFTYSEHSDDEVIKRDFKKLTKI